VDLRLIDWIWNVRGSLALVPGQSAEEVFGKLDPLFRQTGTTHGRNGDTLTFSKRDQAAQDKMSIFDSGVLQVEQGLGAPVLRYRLSSRMLLFCFLAPLLFLSFAGLTILAGNLQSPAAETQKEEKKQVELPQHWLDKALGAPAPEKPKQDKEKEKAGAGGDDKKPSPTSAYVFAAIFAVLFVVGRILEDRLIAAQFRKRVAGAGP
jgi:hypothetical protein